MGADITKFIVAIIMFIVVIVVIFSFIGSSSGEITSAGDSITDANNCSSGDDDAGVEYTYNISDGYCYNSSTDGDQKRYVAGQYDLPLNTLFSSTGVILLVLMASILIFVVVLALKIGKKQ